MVSQLGRTGEFLEIDGVEYYYTQAPNRSERSDRYAVRGQEGTVFQLSDDSGQLWALKVFSPGNRLSYLSSLDTDLRQFASKPGLQVCARTVLTNEHHGSLIRENEDLLYACLMQWKEGETWETFVEQRHPISQIESLALASALLDILSSMERAGIAHGDLSGSNLIIRGSAGSGYQLELVDVEKLFAPSLVEPDVLPRGSAGYKHPSMARGLWAASMDRFSGGILLAEILGWANEKARMSAAGNTYFSQGEEQQDTERYRVLQDVLVETWGSQLADLFEQCWRSTTMTDCPAFAEWQKVVIDAVDAAEAELRESPRTEVVMTQDDSADAEDGIEAEIRTMLDQGLMAEHRGNYATAAAYFTRAAELMPPDSPMAKEMQLAAQRARDKDSAESSSSTGKPAKPARSDRLPVAAVLTAVALLALTLFAVGYALWPRIAGDPAFQAGPDSLVTDEVLNATAESNHHLKTSGNGVGSVEDAQVINPSTEIESAPINLIRLVSDPVVQNIPSVEVVRAENAAPIPEPIDPVGKCANTDVPPPRYNQKATVRFRWNWPMIPADAAYLEVRVGPAGTPGLTSLGKVDPANSWSGDGTWIYDASVSSFFLDGVHAYDWRVYYMGNDGQVLLNSFPSCFEVNTGVAVAMAIPPLALRGTPGDTDADGIGDKRDMCVEVHAGDEPDPQRPGCPMRAKTTDIDGDGVRNDSDKCPTIPAGQYPDSTQKGCPRDTDGDKWWDSIDSCPAKDAGAQSDPDRPGCPLDSDNDGFADAADYCAEVPAGSLADSNRPGCPLVDSDNDGVSDATDFCVDLPAGNQPNPLYAGCPLVGGPDPDGDDYRGYEDQCPKVAAGANPDPNWPGCPFSDADGDGFSDLSDYCVTEPVGNRPDPQWPGCPLGDDDDEDGVPNLSDNCPTISAGSNADPGWPGCPFSDYDEDGLSDLSDSCPETPQGPNPDPQWPGCPFIEFTDQTDSDSDGVLDVADFCISTPRGDQEDPERPGCPLEDYDNDGISDLDDRCPTIPEGSIGDPNNAGCPLDSDGDRVPDDSDQCVDVSSVNNPDPDRPGCPIIWTPTPDVTLIPTDTATPEPLVDTVTPETPTDTATPVTPETPTDTATPETPETPTDTATPGTPETPTDTATPVTPETPTDTATPVTPETPTDTPTIAPSETPADTPTPVTPDDTFTPEVPTDTATPETPTPEPTIDTPTPALREYTAYWSKALQGATSAHPDGTDRSRSALGLTVSSEPSRRCRSIRDQVTFFLPPC